MKKTTWLTILMALALLLGSVGTVHAEIIPPHGEGQIGLQAVVLCEQLTVRREPGVSAAKVTSLPYGALPIVTERSNGWVRVVLGNSEDAESGWVNADYLAIDPAWYRTEEKTSVYAWDDTLAPKVGLLDKDSTLPILAQRGSWLIVSLRGAVGWILL